MHEETFVGQARLREEDSRLHAGVPAGSSRGWLLALAAWAVASLIHGILLMAQEGVFVLFALAGSGVYYGLLGLLGFAVWKVCAGLHESHWPFWKLAAAHGLMMVTAVAAWQSAYFGFIYLVAGTEVIWIQIEDGGLWLILQAVLTYTAMVIGLVALQTSRRLEQQRRRAGELRLLAREAELAALRAQLRPHFLFNVLNSIYSQVRPDPDKAEKMIDLLAELLRETLDISDQPVISFEREITLTKRYLEIEQLRLGQRLSARFDVDDSALAVPVPPLLLQPLVENAIKHGIRPTSRPTSIEIAVRANDSFFECSVRDSGPGSENGIVEGIGLGITQARLERSYGRQASISYQNLQPHGFQVSLRLPVKPKSRRMAHP